MSWTTEQLESLCANVYANRLICPGCGRRLKLERSKQPEEFGQVECSKCNQSHLIARRDSFREYSEAERKQIMAVDKRRFDPICPIDGTAMVVYAQRSLALNSQVRIRCPRCGGKVEFKRLYG